MEKQSVVYLHSGILFHSKKDQAAEYHVYFKVDETGSVERRQMQEMENWFHLHEMPRKGRFLETK